MIPSNRKRHQSDHFHVMTDTSMRCESFLGQHTIENLPLKDCVFKEKKIPQWLKDRWDFPFWQT